MSHVDFWVCLNYFLQRCSHIFVWQSYDWVKSRNKSPWVKFPQSVSTESSISILQFQLKIFESVSAICLVENSGILSQIGGLLQVTWDLGLLGLILDPIVDYSLELNSSASTHWVDDDMVGFEWNMLYYWKWPRVCVDKTFPKCFVAQGFVLQIEWNLPWNWSQRANCFTYFFDVAAYLRRQMKYHQYLMINMHHQMMINMILIISDEGRVVGRVAAYLRHQMMISHICSIQTPSDRIFSTFDKVRGGSCIVKGGTAISEGRF